MKGRSLTEDEKKYIRDNRESKFLGQIATELDLCQPTVRRFLKRESDSS